ncbi:hypothetical protein PRIPAC_84761 [Pristionchus pacificus]|uniref:Uncharacterized protein n=1 Tax=Pristionchus pacificus TaxID=54126 RepID=A0A2A6BTY0_PRIPA|nr:hypothetical protein PRIPAC_84761 [Pristionchus pacificus]|eukprot:PDM69266.1 hypothetical protein PRIPAC_47568 [Pristionchus pacificus]
MLHMTINPTNKIIKSNGNREISSKDETSLSTLPSLFFACEAEFDGKPMNPFAEKLYLYANSETPHSEKDHERVGYILFCHFDDKDSCVHWKKTGCDCSDQCTDFSGIFTWPNLQTRKTIARDTRVINAPDAPDVVVGIEVVDVVLVDDFVVVVVGTVGVLPRTPSRKAII